MNKRRDPIQLFKPSFGEEELAALRDIFDKGWVGLGPKTAEFEQAFALYTGGTHCVGVNSCTAALDMAIRLLDIGKSDEVIVPTVTFVSSAHAVVYSGARPVFADVESDTLNIDSEDVKRKITARTKAIIAVHYSGRPCDMTGLAQVAGDIPIIEDAAHATGAYFGGRHVGTFGRIGCFSFHAVKNLAMGDGGALLLSDARLAERARRMRWLGIDKSTWDRAELEERYWWEYAVNEIGLKCHMNDIQAAIGLVQLSKLETMNRRRREIVSLYYEQLGGMKELELPVADDAQYRSSWHIFCIKCTNRNRLSAYLAERYIHTGVHYKPIHLYNCYDCKTSLPVAEGVFERILSLPLHPQLSDEDVAEVCRSIREFYG